MARRDDKIVIRYFAVPNANVARGGFMPMFETNGRLRGSSYGRGYDRADAERFAEAEARDEAARYVGDWRVSVAKGGEAYVRAALARDKSRLERR